MSDSAVISPSALTMETKAAPVRRQLSSIKDEEELQEGITVIDEAIEAANEEIAKEIEKEEDEWVEQQVQKQKQDKDSKDETKRVDKLHN